MKTVHAIQFFKERNFADNSLLDLINSMNILALPAGKTVMEFGEVGDNFYFILFGEVEIQIPDQNLL